MHSANSFVDESVQVFWPRILFRLFCVVIPCGILIFSVIYPEIKRVYFSVKAGQGYVIAILFFCTGTIVWTCLIFLKLVIYPECVTVQMVFPFSKYKRVNYVWSSIADITEHRWLLLGKVLVLHRADGVAHGIIWLSGWRHSKRLKKVLMERLQENGGRYIEAPLFPNKE